MSSTADIQPKEAVASTSSSVSYNSKNSETASLESVRPRRRRFESSRLIGEYEKPWLDVKDKAWNWESIIFYTFVFIGFAIGGYLCYDAYIRVPQHDYCLVLDEQFKTLDDKIWNHEIQLNGFGTGSFDWTTDDPANSYVAADGLHILPTLTTTTTNISAAQLQDGYTVNLTADGSCSNDNQKSKGALLDTACVTKSNSTTGIVVNPVRSARLNTKGKATIRYGRVEVVAKLPRGDWLWPAIWMMPQDSVYGEWPRSGEIDIMESRGNSARDYPEGNSFASSTLHWGTTYSNDAYYRTTGSFGNKRTNYSDDFHTFGLEWSQKYLFVWFDGRLRQVLFFDFSKQKDLWTYGEFAGTAVHNTAANNPWADSLNNNAPFDQEFYLILNVAVGGTNGYFPDGIGGKPWSDKSTTAMKDFWQANSTWLDTWGTGDGAGMTVKSVKMYQEGAC